jgi:hypothetical protein
MVGGEYMVKVKQSLVGQVFGRLTVVEQAEDYIYVDKTGKEYHYPRWNCTCECGNFKTINGQELKNGDTNSCGCLQKELLKEKIAMMLPKNTYDLSGNYGSGKTIYKEEYWFDIEDYERIKDHYWQKNDNGYFYANIDGHVVFMRRLIMDCDDNMIVDHKAHKTFDNRKSQLRICNKAQNGQNRKLSSNNTSGCSGVFFSKQHSKWRAQIRYNNKRIELGLYVNFNDAVKARKDAEEKYFGSFSYDNSLQEEDNELQQSSQS